MEVLRLRQPGAAVLPGVGPAVVHVFPGDVLWAELVVQDFGGEEHVAVPEALRRGRRETGELRRSKQIPTWWIWE